MARIGLVAHDDKKDELVAWALANRDKLGQHELWGTGTTGGRVIDGTGIAGDAPARAVRSAATRNWAR